MNEMTILGGAVSHLQVFGIHEVNALLELAVVWKSHMSTVYMDLTLMLTKWRSWLSLYLLMDIIICVIVTLLNGNWLFKLMGGIVGCSWK